MEKLFRLAALAVLPLFLTHPCIAQSCSPALHPETDSGYTYIRQEVKALHWIRNALLESTKIQPPGAPEDPQNIQKLAELHATANAVADRYNCAVSILQNFKDSQNEYIHESVENLLTALEAAKGINDKLVAVLDSLYDTQKQKSLDRAGIANMLEDVKSIQRDTWDLSIAGTQASTSAIFKMEWVGEDSRPVAFNITHDQRNTLRAEAETLAHNGGFNSYIDDCAEILLNDLAQDLPEAPQ